MYPYAEFWASTWWLVTRRPARGYYPHDCPAHGIVAEAAGKMAHLSWKNKQGELSTWASPKPIVHLNKGKERGRAAVVSRQNNIWQRHNPEPNRVTESTWEPSTDTTLRVGARPPVKDTPTMQSVAVSRKEDTERVGQAVKRKPDRPTRWIKRVRKAVRNVGKSGDP